jgi:RNA polymerase sigma-70 factor (ECF subfamily)
MGQDSAASAEPNSLGVVRFGELLTEAQRGSNDELGRLLEEYRPYLLAIANHEFPQALGGKIAASDVVQETIIQGYQQFAAFRGLTSEECGRWLRRILLNHLANVSKSYDRQKRQVGLEQPADSGLTNPRQLSPSGEAMSREDRASLDAAIERLPELYRQVVALRHQENLGFAEIGSRLGRTDEAARKLWARAVQQLQKELGIDGATPAA